MTSVLIVEDDVHLGGFLAASLARGIDELQVFTAATVEDAMRWLGVRPFQALLIDVLLPDGNGIDLARCAKVIDPRVNVVMMTGSPSTAIREKAREAGAALFLEKPFDIEDLRTIVLALAATARKEARNNA